MDALAELFIAIIYGWLVALIFIGPFQVIAALIRAALLKNWHSEFGIRLKKYLIMLIAYWTTAGICFLLNYKGIDIDWVFFVFVPILCTALATYYWRAIYLLSKSNMSEEIT